MLLAKCITRKSLFIRIVVSIFTILRLCAHPVTGAEAPPGGWHPQDLLNEETETDSDSVEPTISDPLEQMRSPTPRFCELRCIGTCRILHGRKGK